MTRHAHDEARELIALGETLSDAQQTWLRAHLGECDACLHYADAAGRLVRTTQMRVRMRAGELQQRRERLLFVAMSCALVAVSSALTTLLLWRGFAWLGRWSDLPTPVWQVGFVLFWIAPTLAASLLFLAHGTHWSGHSGKAFRG